MPVMQLATPDLPILPRNFAHAGFALFVIRCSRMGVTLFASNFAHLELPFLARCFSRSDSTVLTAGPVHSGTVLPPQHLVNMEVSVPVLGLSWLGFCFSSPAMERSTLGSALPLRSFLQPELVLFVPGLAHLDSLTFLRSLAHLEKILSALGCGRSGFVFSLPTAEWVNTESSPLPKSPAKLELALLVLGCFETGLSLTSQGST